MREFGDFFKRIKVKSSVEECKNNTSITKSNSGEDIQIDIKGDIGLFEDEKEKIIEGAKTLLQMGKADNMEDAIITFAVMFRGLKFCEVQKSEDGKTIVVLKEIAQIERTVSKEER